MKYYIYYIEKGSRTFTVIEADSAQYAVDAFRNDWRADELVPSIVKVEKLEYVSSLCWT